MPSQPDSESSSITSLSAEVDKATPDEDRLPPVSKIVQMLVTLWDDNNEERCFCSGASGDCRYPPPCEMCVAREFLRRAASPDALQDERALEISNGLDALAETEQLKGYRAILRNAAGCIREYAGKAEQVEKNQG